MSRRADIAGVLLTHTFSGEVGECVCGYTTTSTLALAFHVADEIERAIGGAA